MPKRLIIAIDGPSGAGKSTVARMLARQLGYTYVESGAMYRAVALIALQRGCDLSDAASLEKLAAEAKIDFEFRDAANRILVNGVDVTQAIRSPAVTEAASIISAYAGVRKELVAQQRALGERGGVIMEGRDIGTKVFPDADVKIFLDASLAVRGERRLHDEKAVQEKSLTAVMKEMDERDRRDREREESPLTEAENSIRIDSTHLTAEEVVQGIVKWVEEKRENQKQPQTSGEKH